MVDLAGNGRHFLLLVRGRLLERRRRVGSGRRFAAGRVGCGVSGGLAGFVLAGRLAVIAVTVTVAFASLLLALGGLVRVLGLRTCVGAAQIEEGEERRVRL